MAAELPIALYNTTISGMTITTAVATETTTAVTTPI